MSHDYVKIGWIPTVFNGQCKPLGKFILDLWFWAWNGISTVPPLQLRGCCRTIAKGCCKIRKCEALMKAPITCMHALWIVSDAKSQRNEHKRATFLHVFIFFTSRRQKNKRASQLASNAIPPGQGSCTFAQRITRQTGIQALGWSEQNQTQTN